MCAHRRYKSEKINILSCCYCIWFCIQNSLGHVSFNHISHLLSNYCVWGIMLDEHKTWKSMKQWEIQEAQILFWEHFQVDKFCCIKELNKDKLWKPWSETMLCSQIVDSCYTVRVWPLMWVIECWQRGHCCEMRCVHEHLTNGKFLLYYIFVFEGYCKKEPQIKQLLIIEICCLIVLEAKCPRLKSWQDFLFSLF
jgi:hypothetical protein